MQNVNLVRAKAESALHSNDVNFIREMSINREDCSLSVWTSGNVLNPKTAVILEAAGTASCVNKTVKSFGKMLKVIRPSFADFKLIKSLFTLAGPEGLQVVDSKDHFGWLPRYEGIWHLPGCIDQTIEFFCCNLTSGRFFRIQISDSYDLEIEDIGPGKVFRKR